MDFRRIPFNFSSTDPLKRQEELQRRFGLSANKNNMYVDFANSAALGNRSDVSSISNSPRLQHRVPIFVEGQSELKNTSVDTSRNPQVRVVPIEIEGEDNTSKRRWLFGSSEPIKERVCGTPVPVETVKCAVKDPVPPSPKAPRVCNIPIKIEGCDPEIQPSVKTQKVKTPESSKCAGLKLNGCSPSKVTKVNEQNETCKTVHRKESPEQAMLEKIKNIEEKLKGYHVDVEKFSGTNKEKQYRYLDEMLTRCMLELDEIDTMGLDTVRLARKAAVKKVQASVDLLESKIIKAESKQDQIIKEPMEVESAVEQMSENADDAKMKFTSADAEETKNSAETVIIGTSMDEQVNVETGNISVEMVDALPEQINEKVENISILKTVDGVEKSETGLTGNIDNLLKKTSIIEEKTTKQIMEPEQITEVGADDNVTSEMEPVIEEPLSDSKDEIAVDMDLDSCNYERDLNDTSSFQIGEVWNDISDSDVLKAGVSRNAGQNVVMEVAESSDIPVVTEQTLLSNAGLTTAEQSAASIILNTDSDSIIISDRNVSIN